MANIPMSFPVTWHVDNTIYINNINASIAVNTDGTILLKGSIKEAALALIKYAVDENKFNLCIELSINKSLVINYLNGINIYFKGNIKPDFWDELICECERIKKMKVFW